MSRSCVAAGARVVLAARAMATRFELVLAGEDERSLRAAGEEALREIEAQERALSLFQVSSLLSHVHRSAGREWVRLEAVTWELFCVCGAVYGARGGAFDPCVGGRMRELGFHLVGGFGGTTTKDTEGGRGHGEEKQGERKGELRNWGHVALDAGRRAVRLDDPCVRLDFGGVAKGHALDLAGRVLREAGVGMAFLQGGTSSVLAIGAPPGREGWVVALGGASGAPRVVLRDRALGVSARHGRVLKDGTAHVLDPRTGRSARGPTYAAVVASSAALADAWSTALLVAGEMPVREGVETLVAYGPPEDPGWRAGAPASRVLFGPHVPRP